MKDTKANKTPPKEDCGRFWPKHEKTMRKRVRATICCKVAEITCRAHGGGVRVKVGLTEGRRLSFEQFDPKAWPYQL
jgi:hypothetical protein